MGDLRCTLTGGTITVNGTKHGEAKAIRAGNEAGRALLMGPLNLDPVKGAGQEAQPDTYNASIQQILFFIICSFHRKSTRQLQ